MLHRILAGCLVLAIATTPALAAGPLDRAWSGAGIVIASFNLQNQQITAVDSGAAVCRSNPAESGVGGNCVPFTSMTSANAIRVTEDCAQACLANRVTFQVCVDNNGDGVCKGLADVSDDHPMPQPYSCQYDSIFYSHSTTTTRNRNPLHVPAWAKTFWQSCGGLGYPGYVVLVCAGAHNNRLNTDPHTHTATAGTLGPAVTADFTSGNYCGAPTATKAYRVV